MKILLVEDEPSVAAFLHRGLTEQEYTVDLAADGLLGLRRAQSTRYDCLILDQMLPGLSGLDVCRQVRAHDPGVPILMLTAKVQEAENQVVIAFEVYDQRPSDSDLLIPAIEMHEQRMGRTPDLAAGDAGFYSAKNVAKAQQAGVKRVSVPSRSTKSAALKREQKKRWFKKGQKWRTGCEGRISVLKRRHGLDRCRYKGVSGMKRWTGLGVIADNLINIARAIDKQQSAM